MMKVFLFFASRRQHTRSTRDWSSDVCSSDLGASGQRTTLTDTATRVPSVPPHLLEQSLARAEGCCLVDPANNEEITVVLRSAARAQVPLFLSLGTMQIGLLGYHGLNAALEEEVEVLMCSALEALRLTNCDDVAGQLEA